ncbi:hypothetical protein ACSTHO_23620, partial [Vibrio parahaemolyticus]
TEEQWICAVKLEFSDGGVPEGQLIHRGTKEECERVYDMLPAISYRGSRPVSEARLLLMVDREWLASTKPYGAANA